MMLTEKDEFIYHEMITHVPMAVHPDGQKGTGNWSRGWRRDPGADPLSGNRGAHRYGGDRPAGGGGLPEISAEDSVPS